MIQLKTILAPVDLSDQTEHSLGYAFNLAHHYDSRLILFHAVPVARFPVVREGVYASKSTEGLSTDIEKRVISKIDALVQDIAPRKQVETMIERGDPARKIVERAEKESVDLIVIPTRGHGRFRRFLLGSVTSKVLDDVDCPVFTGIHFDPIPPFEPKSFHHIGCAIDLGNQSENVLRWARDFAQSFEARLTVVHTVLSIQAVAAAPVMSDSKMETVYDARGRIEKLLHKTGTEADILIEHGPVEKWIKDADESKNFDTLIIGRHEDGLLGKLHPHAYGIIRESPCPVISV